MKNNSLYQIYDCLLQLLFPLRCPVCDRPVKPFGEKICRECIGKLQPITAPWCMKCGRKLLDRGNLTQGDLCSNCMEGHHEFIRGRSLYLYKSAAPSIFRFKYGGRQEYAEIFGEEMAYFLENFITLVKPDGLIPVPLHKKRQRKRGYNQAALLARVIGRQLHIPVYDKLVVRKKNTKPLKNQNPKERQNNLKKAFIIAQNDVKLNTIIIIDDIYTTGSTIDEMAAVLKAGGIRNIYFCALAGPESL